MRKKILAYLTCFTLLAALLPSAVFADVRDPESSVVLSEDPETLSPESEDCESISEENGPESDSDEPEYETVEPEPVSDEPEYETVEPEPVSDEPEPISDEPESVSTEPESAGTEPAAISIESAVVSGIVSKTYTGSAITQKPKVMLGETLLKEGTDYKVSYSNNKNAGKAQLIITGIGNYTGTIIKKFNIKQAGQLLTPDLTSVSPAVGRNKTVKISGAKGILSYTSSNENCFKIKKARSGCRIIGVKVGTGTVTVTAAESKDGNYKAAKIKIKVKVVPKAVPFLKAENVSSGVKLKWEAVPGAKGYKIYNGEKLLKTIRKNSTVKYISKATKTNGKKYTFRIVPYASTGDGLSKARTWYYLSRPGKPGVTSKTAKKAAIKWEKNKKATGYEIQYSLKSSFPGNGAKTVKITDASVTSKVISGLSCKKTYYFRIRSIRTVNDKTYRSLWSPANKVRIPENTVKPSVKAASLSASGQSAGVVHIKGSVRTKVRSDDNYYYLFEVNANNDKLVQMIASAKKASSFAIDLNTDENAAYPIMKYALAVKTGSGTGLSDYKRISPAVYVTKPEKTAACRTAYYYPATKKGLQAFDYYQLEETNSKTCFFNIYVSEVINGGTVPFDYNGTTYYFNDLWKQRALVSECNRSGIQVSTQIMLDEAGPDIMKAATGGEFLYGFNVTDRDARMWMDAMFLYLSKIFGTDDCYISNWVLGNEINSCSFYWYMGNPSEDEFIDNYTNCFRDFYNAVRSVRCSSRVFICLEHCWTTTNEVTLGFEGKSILKKFNAAIKKIQKGVRWNLAYHPYPKNFRVPSFWNDKLSSNANATIISPKNLSALTSYIRDEYGSNTRIIISEIGFNIIGSNEDTQAAAMALAYDICACDPMIDGFMARAYVDDAGDAMYGVALGIKGRKAFDVFKYMDTPNYLQYTQPVLNAAVGPDWTNYVNGYDPAAIYGMYIRQD